jgi:outer membrane protein assembly factor BamB
MVLGRPTVRGGVVYAGSYDGHMYCIEADTGTLVDRFRTEGEIYSSPAADENAVYFGNNKGRFIALNHAAKDA